MVEVFLNFINNDMFILSSKHTNIQDDVGSDDYLGSVILDDRLADLLQAGDELREHWSDLAGVERGKVCYSVWCTETQVIILN